MMIEILPLFGEPERPEVLPPPPVGVRWVNRHVVNRVQCAHCVQVAHALGGAGPVDIRAAVRRRVSADGDLLLCSAHAFPVFDDDVRTGRVRRRA